MEYRQKYTLNTPVIWFLRDQRDLFPKRVKNIKSRKGIIIVNANIRAINQIFYTNRPLIQPFTYQLELYAQFSKEVLAPGQCLIFLSRLSKI